MLVVLLLVGVAPAWGADEEFVGLDRTGPPLSVPPDALAASLRCSDGLDGATRTPVLLNPATGVTGDQNYSWNYERAFKGLGIPYCVYTAPESTLADIQVSGEYLVNAIRTMHARAGRPIAIIGHSQGGMSMRWALRFWPDTRAMVDDVVGYAGSNHGTTALSGSSGKKPPASWQQGSTSNFLRALNSRAETFSGVSYTNVYTHFDEVVQPSTGPNPSSALRTGGGRIANVAVQDVCAGDVSDHLAVGTIDPVAYALTIDALTHDGPADPTRIDRRVCLTLLQPGVDPLTANTYLQVLAGAPGLLSVASPVPAGDFPSVASEPGLACYVLAACAGTGPQNLIRDPSIARRGCTSRRLFLITLPRGLRRVVVKVDGRRVKVRKRGGRPTARIDLRGKPRKRVRVLVVAATRKGKRVRDVRRYRTCVKG